MAAAAKRARPEPVRPVTVKRTPPTVSRAKPPTAVRVSGGDSIYGIARRHGVSVRALIDENSLSAPFRLVVGQLLALPVKRFHTVAKGDTIYGLSRRYGVQANSLVMANHITAPYTLAVGQRLLLPTAAKPKPVKIVQAQATSKTVPVSKPDKRKIAVSPPPRKPSPRQASASKAAPAKTSRPKHQKAAIKPAASSSRFNWPLRGTVISRFGPKAGGLHNDGINIAAKGGAPVRAAESGVVAYAGNELRGFGNLVLVRHRGGWTTAYAHAEKLLVKRGDRVRRGQVLAKVGKTGGVTRHQLHFEIRRRGDAVDPLAHLARATTRG